MIKRRTKARFSLSCSIVSLNKRSPILASSSGCDFLFSSYDFPIIMEWTLPDNLKSGTHIRNVYSFGTRGSPK